MTDQYRATPEQWEHVQICAGMKQQIPWATADCILELRARIEALEATQHAHADLSRLSDAEREQVTQELAKPAACRPLDIVTTCSTEAAIAIAQQILRATSVVEGTFEHGGETYRFKAKPERESATTELRAAGAEARPAERLWERMEKAGQRELDDNPHAEQAEFYEAMIREVAAWIMDNPGPNSAWSAVARDLMDEADPG
jgi:hypothetical protein